MKMPQSTLTYDALSERRSDVIALSSCTDKIQSSSRLNDRDVLLQLLSKCLPLIEAAIATTALLEHYGDFAEVVAAPFYELLAISCLSETGAHLLKCVHTASIHLAIAPMQRDVSINDWASLSAYLNTSMARERSETVRVLFLNSKNLVIGDAMLGQGMASHVAVSTRIVVEKSLQIGATAIVLLHNHPSGDPLPSAEDFSMTAKIESALALVDVRLHDHIIVGNGLYFSLKGLNLISYRSN